MKKGQQLPSARQLEGYLKARGISDQMIRTMRIVYADRSVRDGADVKMNRLYSVFALGLARYTASKKDRWGTKRITELLQVVSDLYEDFVKRDDDWVNLMQTLRDEVGIVIRTGEEGDEVYEFEDGTEREAKT